MEAFSKIVAIVVTMIALFVVPQLYFLQKLDIQVQDYVTNETTEFVDNIRTQGKLTQQEWLKFMSALDATGLLYEVEITHAHTMVTPEITTNGVIASTSESEHYTDEILYVLFSKTLSDEEKAAGQIEGEYHFTKGDYLTVKVYNREVTRATNLMQAFLGTPLSPIQIFTVYGGEIRDENF